MRGIRRGRMLKRWRYVGLFGPELMLCAGQVRIGPARQSFWAVWDRGARVLHERTVLRDGPVRVEPGRVTVADRDARIELELDEGDGVEVVTPDGRGYAWTRKQAGVPARGRVVVSGHEHAVDGLAVVDESAGYHARRTAWRWSTGVGRTVEGRAVGWNLVTGIHDSPERSERTVWVDGEPHEVGPVRFAPDLSAVEFAEGGSLRCAIEAVRERDDNLLLIRSRYGQPFGTFSGSLPGAGELAEGYGVMERHEVVW